MVGKGGKERRMYLNERTQYLQSRTDSNPALFVRSKSHLNRGMPLQEAAIMAGYSKTETTMMYCLVDQESVQHHYKKYLSA